ncbi:hypothetical protein JB92DRAFT_2867933 [Gautieria morchelliformis]|nr:hypothetical protein JB92DRAFT_2867933 [Gautieria morchelliformis]
MLHLFARLVTDLCLSAEILRHASELPAAFDEIVSLAWRDQINLMQVKSKPSCCGTRKSEFEDYAGSAKSASTQPSASCQISSPRHVDER